MMYHNPVLLEACMEGLKLQTGGVYVDVTFGGGGHSRRILESDIKQLVAFDQDEDAHANAINDERFLLVKQNFKYLKNFLRLHNINEIDGLLADLGVSSHQFDAGERGFSIRFDGPLDLRMDQKNPLSAAKLLETYSEEKLSDVFYFYGELHTARKIASTIVKYRAEKNIETTFELKECLNRLAPRGAENKFFAQVFQALRIEVNDELEALKTMLAQATEMLKPGGRLVVISYHSLEDRLVKNFIRSGNFEGVLHKDFYGNVQAPLVAVSRKAIVPSEDEIAQNSRARSAKLRIAEKK